MSALWWVGAILACWCLLSVVTALVLGPYLDEPDEDHAEDQEARG